MYIKMYNKENEITQNEEYALVTPLWDPDVLIYDPVTPLRKWCSLVVRDELNAQHFSWTGRKNISSSMISCVVKI